MATEQIERELAGRGTGFDVLQETKQENIKLTKQLISSGGSRDVVAKKLGVSKRSVTRYLNELRQQGVRIATGSDKQMADKRGRMMRLAALIKKHPDWPRIRFAKAVGVSSRTVYVYFKEL